MHKPIENLRLHFYGVQGSGSTYPTRAERTAFQEVLVQELLLSISADLKTHADAEGRLDCTLEDIFGGPLRRDTLRAYRKRLSVPPPHVYGGWTTCVHIETSDGYDIVLDCGSGFRNCARHLQQKWGDRPERHLYLFGSHSHSDHTEGFDQAAVCFDPRNRLHIHGNEHYLRALDSYLGIFTRHVAESERGLHTPIFFGLMPAGFRGIEIRALAPGEDAAGLNGPFGAVHDLARPIVLGETSITPFEVFHPAPCLAYKIEHGGRTFVYCTDHELRRGPDPADPRQQASLAAEERLRAHARGADVLYRDGQYLRAEYDGLEGIGGSAPVSRLDWGHSCIEDIEEMAVACDVKHTYIGHHDPNRDWNARHRLDRHLIHRYAHGPHRIKLAYAEMVIDL